VNHPGPAAVAGEDGLTLVELLVTMSILLLVAAILLGFLEQTTRLVARTSNDVQAENDARLALRAITQDIRAASPSTIAFTGPTAAACPATPTPATCLSFTIARNTATAPTCRTTVTYGLMASSVLQTRSDANCSSDHSVTRTLIDGVANGTTPLFSYYNAQGGQLSSGQAAAKTVMVTLLVAYAGGQEPLSLTSSLALRNAR
jgi:prepilin-type N-terminal cleavage/methylation domain-containing protein